MAERDAVRLSARAAQTYEREFVPAMFAQWPPQLAEAAEISPGDRVLDVGCGTGVLAREAAARCGPTGQVTGLDLNETMLAVAERVSPDLDWRQGDAAQLPFEDASFDVVASQFMLMFVPDRVGVLEEMWRVLAPAGRLAVAVWSDSPVYPALGEIARAQGADAVAASFEPFFDLGDAAKLRVLFERAGIPGAQVETRDGQVRYPSIEDFLRVEIKGWILADTVDDATYRELLRESRAEFADFCGADGEMVFPMNAHLVTARKD